MKKKLIAPVSSVGDLRNRARTDERYARLAMAAATNLGGCPTDVDSACRWLDLNAMEVDDNGEGIVAEINFCRDLI